MPISDKHLSKLTRRALLIGGGSFALSSLLLARLYTLQFLQGDRYVTLAEGNRIKLHLTPPLRGVLNDRKGVPLATNDQNYRMLLRTEQVTDMEKTLAEIARLVPLDDEKTRETLKKRKPGRYAPPILLKEFLSWDEVAKIEFHSASIPGLVIEIGQVRHYPFAEAFAHVLGYVGIVAESDMDDRDLLKLPDFKVGKDGVEKMLESELRGIPGVKEVEVNVHGLAVRELNTKLSVPGKETALTLDARLQNYGFELFGQESAACVVLDVQTGGILSLISAPAYNPNSFSRGISSKYWKELNANKKVPLLNKALSGQYPPGSVFKMMVGLAGLNKKTISVNDRVYCPGHFMLGNHRFNCWKPGGHGSVNYHDAIAQSCDTFFYTIAKRIGIDPIAEMCHRFGLGEKYPLPLTGQRAGVIPTPDWKRKSYDQPWQGGDTINAAIGQGYVLTTPLQLSVMTARIASGKAVMPRLILPDAANPPLPFEDLPISKTYLDATRKAMADVVNSPSGTAYGKRIMQPEYAMAGKTGTAQVRKILVRGQDQNHLPWEARHHAWFVGYAPLEKPRFAAALIVEHGGGGSAIAAPYVRDILMKMQELEAKDNGTWIAPPPPAPPPAAVTEFETPTPVEEIR